MSSGSSHTIARWMWALSAAVAALSATAYAADPNTPPDPNTPVVKPAAMAKVPTPTPQKQPMPSAVRTPASFTPQMPLSEAIDILRNCTTPPLNIVVLWRSLDGAGIYKDTPIGIDGLPGLRVGQYLDALVLSLSAGASDRIGYTIRGGIITIATTTALPAPRHVTRVYDISDLVAPPSNPSFSPMGMGGMYGNQMAGLAGGYGGLGTRYGTGSPSAPGGSGGLPGFLGSAYNGTQTRPGIPRRR